MTQTRNDTRIGIAARLADALLDEWTPGHSIAMRAGVPSTHHGHDIEPALELLVRDGRAERSTRRSTVVDGTERVYRLSVVEISDGCGCGCSNPYCQV